MVNEEKVIIKEQITLNERFVMVAKLVNLLKFNVKSLKISAKLIKAQIKIIKNFKSTVDGENLKRIKSKYEDLLKIVKTLSVGKSIEAVGKADENLEKLILEAQREIELLELKLNPVPNKIASAIEDTAHKITDAVGGTFTSLKKMPAGGES